MENLFKGTKVMDLLIKATEIQHSKVWKTIFSDEEFDIFILDLIRIKQLFEQGIDETGKVIGYYSWTTENLYNPLKKAGTPYTLKDTGEFYKSMKVLIENDSFIIDADPMKKDRTGHETNLFEKYGEGIIGLTDDNKQILIEEIKERIFNETIRLLQ
jgi:hypothetical protein